MNKYLLVIDLQREFVKDRQGEKVYQKCLNYIARMRDGYTAVIAAVYINKDNPNMQRYLDYTDVQRPEMLDFIPDAQHYHSGYSIKEYPYVQRTDMVDIIGFDTDACVLSAAFDIFNMGVGMHLLMDGIWSSGGKKAHEAGLFVMRRQFGSAVDETTKL